MEPVRTYIGDTPRAMLTVNLTQYASLRSEPKRSGATHRIGNKIEKNAKFQANFKF
jgi:hypothetical protein